MRLKRNKQCKNKWTQNKIMKIQNEKFEMYNLKFINLL